MLCSKRAVKILAKFAKRSISAQAAAAQPPPRDATKITGEMDIEIDDDGDDVDDHSALYFSV